ncbi:hypothetical protein Tco_0351894 [Tanacetum coccineum]
MLMIRDKIKPFVSYKIGDGRSISVWHDKWCNIGPLDSLLSKRDIYEARFDDDAKIIDLISNGKWKWPVEWKNDYPELQLIPIPNLNEQQRISSMEPCGLVFSAQPKTSIHLVVRYSRKASDTGQNFKIWEEMNVKVKLQNSQYSLLNVVSTIATMSLKNNIWTILQKILVASAVYHVWQERNRRNFQNESRKVDVLIKCIKEDVVNQLTTLNVKNSFAVQNVAKVWDLTLANKKLVRMP